MVRSGDIVLMFDGTVRPPKHKRCVCVCAAEGWFLRINMRAIWRPNIVLRVAQSGGGLSHDSYVELAGILDYDMAELGAALAEGEARVLGRIDAAGATVLLEAVRSTPTLNAVEKKAISESLEPLLA